MVETSVVAAVVVMLAASCCSAAPAGRGEGVVAAANQLLAVIEHTLSHTYINGKAGTHDVTELSSDVQSVTSQTTLLYDRLPDKECALAAHLRNLTTRAALLTASLPPYELRDLTSKLHNFVTAMKQVRCDLQELIPLAERTVMAPWPMVPV